MIWGVLIKVGAYRRQSVRPLSRALLHCILPLTGGKASLAAATAAKKSKPPPPKPKRKPSRLIAAPAAETGTALYDYAAQTEGDLSFQAGAAIDIVQRTQNDNGW